MNSFTKIWLEHYRHINFLFICILTSLLQLAVTAITHFGHAVFHVLQRISVSAAAPANNLQQHKRAAPTVGSIPWDKAALLEEWDTHPATAMTVMSAKSEAEI